MATDTSDDVRPAEVDPEDRVHHHARVGDERKAKGRPIITLCGLELSGPRPDAATLPCCPLCAAKMGAAGKTCS